MRGSAAVEFVAMVPFLLAMMGLVWDLRQYMAYRTEVVREMFVVAEIIASEPGSPDNNPIPVAVQRVTRGLGNDGSGGLASGGSGAVVVAVVSRGERQSATDACDADWCLPQVRVRWPPPGTDTSPGDWGEDDLCDGFDPRKPEFRTDLPELPDAGEHFPADMTVLPNEDPDDALPQSDWLSRNLRPQEWWVVVDVCFQPDPGLFGGWVLNGLSFFNPSDSALVATRRTAWGSVNPYAECNWCPQP